MSSAMQMFQEVVRLNPYHPDVYELLGEIDYLSGNYSSAYKNFKKAVEQHPNNSKLHNDLGVAAAGRETYLVAIGHFKDALELDPLNRDAELNLKEAQLRQRVIADDLPTDGNVPEERAPDASRFKNTSAPTAYAVSQSGGQGGAGVIKRKAGQSYDYTRRNMDVGGSTDPNISVIAVKATPSRTIVTFKVSNPGRKKEYFFKLAKPGSPDAWYLIDYASNKSYKLMGYLNRREIEQGDAVRVGSRGAYVTAYFKPLALNVFRFHILEGKEPVPGAWNFYDIHLDESSAKK